MAVCKLCKQEKLLRKSHIIPEFMYQNVYDKNPRRFSALKINLDDTDKSTRKFEQKGIREFLFCGDCEVLLSKFESYAAETIYSKNLKNKVGLANASKTADGKFWLYEYSGFSYSPFKLFLMSLFWRILISENHSSINSSEAVREALRSAIYSEDPLKYDNFGCFIQLIRYNEEQIASQFILSPYTTIVSDSPLLHILIDGFMYSFYFNSENINPAKKDFFLKEDGTLKILGRIIYDDPILWEKVNKSYKFYGTLD
jgi:hypothetical protein